MLDKVNDLKRLRDEFDETQNKMNEVQNEIMDECLSALKNAGIPVERLLSRASALSLRS